MHRLRAAALLALLGLSGSAVLALAQERAVERLPAPTRCADADAVQRLGEWEAVRAPRFAQRTLGAGPEVTAYAVHPYRPSRRFATNGTSVERTDDGGCTWREVHVLPDAPSDEDPQSVAGSRIVELVVPEDPRGADRLLLLVQDEGGAPHVLVSEDGGTTPFERRDDGLPARARATDLMVSPSNPDFLFLSVKATGEPGKAAPALPAPLPAVPDLPGLPDVPGLGEPTATSPGALYASVDGGRTWEARLDLADLSSNASGIDALTGDPVAPNRLWALADGVLLASRDAGRSFDGAAPTAQEQRARGWRITALAAASRPSSPARLLALTASSAQGGGPRLLRSTDGGATFDEVQAPGPVESAALVGAGRGVLAVSTTSPVRLLTTPDPFAAEPVFTDRTPLPTDVPLSVVSDRSELPTLHARTKSALLRYIGRAVAVRPPDAAPVGDAVTGTGLPPLRPASIAPSAVELTLQVGEQRRVNHVLTPPLRRTPLDLFVLVDTSESMVDDLAALRGDLVDLVDHLRRAGVDLEVGLGEFKGQESSVAYRRVVGVGPDQVAFRRGLDALRADGFGEEAQLIALDQALTGRGETAADLVPAACKASPRDPDRFVLNERRTAPPTIAGQQADFRPGAVPVVLTVTDTNFLRPAGTPLKPDCTVDVEGVAGRYRDAGVFQVGVGLDDVDNPARAADLLLGASITGALQPPGRTCAPGIVSSQPAPAVCRRAVDLAPSLERLVSAATEPADLTVVAPAGSVVRPETTLLRAVDLREGSPLDLPVTYSCLDVEPGSYTGDLGVQLDGRTVARVAVQVRCELAPQVAAPPLPPPAVAAVPLIGLLPPPAALPPPAPPAQVVQPQVQTQPQAQAQTQVQTGTQDQEQTAQQLALALQSAAQEEQLSVQPMSAREVPDVVRLTLLALMTAAAGGWAVRHRAAPVQVRRGGR